MSESASRRMANEEPQQKFAIRSFAIRLLVLWN